MSLHHQQDFNRQNPSTRLPVLFLPSPINKDLQHTSFSSVNGTMHTTGPAQTSKRGKRGEDKRKTFCKGKLTEKLSKSLMFMESVQKYSTFPNHLAATSSFQQERWHYLLKGSVERSLLPWAIFLIFTRNRPWKSEDHLCMLFFYWNVKGKTRKKRKNTASFVASLGAGVQPRSTLQPFMPISGVEKPPFSQFFLGFGMSFGEEKPFVTSNANL